MSLRTKWVKVEGKVVDVNRRVSRALPGYSVIFSYRAGKHRYSGVYTMWRARGIGTPIGVEYDPEKPKRVRRMVRQKMARYVLPLLLVGLFVVWVKHLSRDAAGAPAAQQRQGVPGANDTE
jgi:hypothetical protein